VTKRQIQAPHTPLEPFPGQKIAASVFYLAVT